MLRMFVKHVAATNLNTRNMMVKFVFHKSISFREIKNWARWMFRPGFFFNAGLKKMGKK